MNITVFGAGAMGTLYGAGFARAGHRVTMVARGSRRAELDAQGLRIRQRGSERTETFEVPTLERLDGHETDVIAVLVRTQHLEAVLPALARQSADVAMMVNIASGYAAWRSALGSRFFVGFPGAIGRFVEGVVEYEIAPRMLQATVVGEPEGPPSERARAFSKALREAGFPVELRSDMETWQRTHAAWITPFMLTAALAGKTPDAFATADSLAWWVDAMREGLDALRAEGLIPTPLSIRALGSLPRPLVVKAAQAVLLASRPLRAHLVATGVASAEEGVALAADMIDAGREHGCEMPRLEALLEACSGG